MKKSLIISAALAGVLVAGTGVGVGIYMIYKKGKVNPDDPCKSVTCPKGQSCNPKTGGCEDDSVTTCPTPCGDGLVCDPVNHQCICTLSSCPAPSQCVDGVCVPPGDPCSGITCPKHTVCSAGKCVCTKASCPDPLICKDDVCQQRTCEDGCLPGYVCMSGYCEPKAVCHATEVWVPKTNTCEPKKTCDDDAGYALDPSTNECVFIGRTGITDLAYLVNPGVDSNPTTCPAGFKSWSMGTNFRRGSVWAPVYGCRKQERSKTTGLVDFSLAFKANCPANTVQDSTDLNPGSPGKLFTCKTYGDVTSPYLIRDIDAVDYTKGERCENLGTGWSYAGWQMSWGATRPVHDIRVCVKRGKL